MIIETIAFTGFVFVAATLAGMLYERRQDVLHGPYIQGREQGVTLANLLALFERVLESSGLRQGYLRAGVKAGSIGYFASAIIG